MPEKEKLYIGKTIERAPEATQKNQVSFQGRSFELIWIFEVDKVEEALKNIKGLREQFRDMTFTILRGSESGNDKKTTIQEIIDEKALAAVRQKAPQGR